MFLEIIIHVLISSHVIVIVRISFTVRSRRDRESAYVTAERKLHPTNNRANSAANVCTVYKVFERSA